MHVPSTRSGRSTLLTERYAQSIALTLSCFHRLMVQGTLQRLGYAEGMTAHLHLNQIPMFDFPRFAQPFRNMVCGHIEQLA